jgi:hypothetical protein
MPENSSTSFKGIMRLRTNRRHPHGDQTKRDDGLRYGVNSMELLINRLLRYGARRNRLAAKLFGGARAVAGMSDVGAQTRRLRYEPTKGAARQSLLRKVDPRLFVEQAPKRAPDIFATMRGRWICFRDATDMQGGASKSASPAILKAARHARAASVGRHG